MSKLTIKIIFILLLMCQAVWAQSFEGTITYKMNLALSEQQKKEMAQMEQMGYSMPTGFEVSSKNTNSRMKVISSKGTMMEMITSSDKDESYLLDRVEKKAYKLPSEPENSSTAKPKVTKTDEFETIAGYKCRKYIIEGNSGMTQHVWASPELKMPIPKFSSGLGGGIAMIEGVDGIPLKMVVKGGGNSSEVVATAVNKTKINADDIKVPSDYAVEPFNPMIIGKMMGGGR